MADMWSSRAPPVRLDFDAIKNDNFMLGTSAKAAATNGVAHASGSSAKPAKKSKKIVPISLSSKRQTRRSSRLAAASGSTATEKLLNGTPNVAVNGVTTTHTAPEGLKDQRKLSLKDNLELFVAR
jgi:ubiquitin-like 1-activating enzyme E1 B